MKLAGFSRAPIGTGPYKVVQVIPGQEATMDKNPDYFKKSQPPWSAQDRQAEFRGDPRPGNPSGTVNDLASGLDLARAFRSD
ncbi:MAG: ABC transporter substrate-binding protein [Symbiopectobacterium sp.]